MDIRKRISGLGVVGLVAAGLATIVLVAAAAWIVLVGAWVVFVLFGGVGGMG